MGLHLWHGDEQVRAQSRIGEVERAEARELAVGTHARYVIQVEIHKDVFEARHGFEVPAASARSSVLRRCPGPSAMRTLAAPIARKASEAHVPGGDAY